MTRDEAKTKWCPFARSLSAGGDASFNRDNTNLLHDANNNCIVEKCMAWKAISIGHGYCKLMDKP